MINVVHLMPDLFPYGGTAQKYYAWVKNTVFAHTFLLYHGWRQDWEYARRFELEGAKIIVLDAKSLLGQVREILQLMRPYDKICLLGHDFRGAVLGCLVSSILNSPHVIPLHGTAGSFSSAKRIAYKTMFRLAEKTIYNSECTAKSFHWIGRHELIYDGIDYSKIPVKREFQQSQNIKLLGIGGLIQSKNYHLLIHMMKLLPSSFKLTIVGDGSQRSALQDMIDTYELGRRVTLSGYISDAAKEVASADVFLHPSVKESFGIAVLEALFAQTPVVVTDRCATWEIIKGGEYGWVADAQDPAAWAEAVMNIVENPIAAWEKAVRGRIFAAEHFSDKAFSANMDNCVEELFRSRQ